MELTCANLHLVMRATKLRMLMRVAALRKADDESISISGSFPWSLIQSKTSTAQSGSLIKPGRCKLPVLAPTAVNWSIFPIRAATAIFGFWILVPAKVDKSLLKKRPACEWVFRSGRPTVTRSPMPETPAPQELLRQSIGLCTRTAATTNS